jgi:hypothetical protein
MNSLLPVTMWDLIDAIAKLHVINDKSSGTWVNVNKQSSPSKSQEYHRSRQGSKASEEGWERPLSGLDENTQTSNTEG